MSAVTEIHTVEVHDVRLICEVQAAEADHIPASVMRRAAALGVAL